MTAPMDVLPEVADALADGKPVVALESTIISHGLPFPRNLETAKQVSATVREGGAVPATIAVIEGRVQIGLSDGQLDWIADPANKEIRKVTRANFAATIAEGASGATTVAATMIAAHLAGIPVFATGGIGGVHRGAAESFDISADLQELAQTPVIVVCAGAKAILDIPKTLEVLETLGVPVVTVGQKDFPAFWSRSSGLASPLSLAGHRIDTLAATFTTHQQLGKAAGMLVANPIPDSAEIPADIINPAIETAVREAETTPGIEGARVTPFLLQRIFEITEGRSLVANVALVLNNARLAAEIARQLCQPDGIS